MKTQKILQSRQYPDFRCQPRVTEKIDPNWELVRTIKTAVEEINLNMRRLSGIVSLTKGFWTNLVNVTTTATLVISATQRLAVTLVNPYPLSGPMNVFYIGNRSVTAGTGLILPREGQYSFVLEPDTEIYAVSSAGTLTLNYIAWQQEEGFRL